MTASALDGAEPFGPLVDVVAVDILLGQPSGRAW